MRGSKLTHDHPVNVQYPLRTSEYWQGTATTTGVRFTPSTFDMVYGHPVRLYVSGGIAYVECGTCHDPHNHTVATVVINGQTLTKPTAHFVRGWFEPNTYSNSVSLFCRSCHYVMSNEAYGRISTAS
jgi:hypothetical protein